MQKRNRSKRIVLLFNVHEWHSLRERAEKLLSGLKDEGYSLNLLFRKKNRLKTLLFYIKGIASLKPDIVYLMDFGFSTAVPVLVLRIFFSFKIILDTGDITYELFRSTGRNWLSLIIVRILEPIIWRLSSAIIVRGIYYEEYLKNKGYKDVYYIPDGVDLEVFKPLDVTELRRGYGLENMVTVGVVGSLNWVEKYDFCYGWELVSALRFLKSFPVKGIIIGDGTGLEKLKELVKEYGIKGMVLFLGMVPYSELPQYINLMDICLSTQSNDIVGNVRTTGKLPLYMACNKYILSTRVGTAKYVLPQEMLIDYTGVRDDEYPERLANAIRDLIDKRERLKFNISIREIAGKNFDYKKLSSRVKEIIMESKHFRDGKEGNSTGSSP